MISCFEHKINSIIEYFHFSANLIIKTLGFINDRQNDRISMFMNKYTTIRKNIIESMAQLHQMMKTLIHVLVWNHLIVFGELKLEQRNKN